jgi:hypothetical protein
MSCSSISQNRKSISCLRIANKKKYFSFPLYISNLLTPLEGPLNFLFFIRFICIHIAQSIFVCTIDYASKENILLLSKTIKIDHPNNFYYISLLQLSFNVLFYFIPFIHVCVCFCSYYYYFSSS